MAIGLCRKGLLDVIKDLDLVEQYELHCALANEEGFEYSIGTQEKPKTKRAYIYYLN